MFFFWLVGWLVGFISVLAPIGGRKTFIIGSLILKWKIHLSHFNLNSPVCSTGRTPSFPFYKTLDSAGHLARKHILFVAHQIAIVILRQTTITSQQSLEVSFSRQVRRATLMPTTVAMHMTSGIFSLGTT